MRFSFCRLWMTVWMGCAACAPPGAGPARLRAVGSPDDAAGEAPAPRQALPADLPDLPRSDFNRLAALLDRPLFWRADIQHTGVLDPDELAVLGVGADRTDFVRAGVFTPAFARTYRAMVEQRRRETVAREVNQGRPTLVYTDLAAAPGYHHRLVRHISRAAGIIEDLYALQNGSFGLRDCLLPQDFPSRALFRRNQGPWCRAPGTEQDPFCNACPGFPRQRFGLYPPELSEDPGMCDKLADHENAEALLDPFTVVRQSPDGLVAVPYHRVWGGRMKQVAGALRAAAGTLPDGERAFRDYLLAAATGFETNRWEAADEAWAAMNATNSMWYLRIGPDEVYFEPCGHKAGFHVSFARIDPDSLFWQEKLTPHRDEMEQALAGLIGQAYKARKVNVHLPDFIKIILNAGDARSPLGATIGQSLPNWGKVAEEGRGRTVVMSNLYTDPDSRAIRRAQASSLLATETMGRYTEDKRLGLLDIILHEATHNFGPHSDTKVDGRSPAQIFGGPLASVLEELKAQTGALYYPAKLLAWGLLDEEEVHRVYNHAIVWCFGHISRGMFTPTGKPKPYSHVAAIHIAHLVREGAMRWEADRTAANGKDPGCFVIEYDRVAKAVEKLMQRVGRIKATGDVEDARALVATYVTGSGFDLVHSEEITERILRYPKASFTYAVRFPDGETP